MNPNNSISLTYSELMVIVDELRELNDQEPLGTIGIMRNNKGKLDWLATTKKEELKFQQQHGTKS